MLNDRKITDWTQPVTSLDDRPQMAAAALKAAFDSNSNQLKPALNGVIDDLTGTGGAGNIGVDVIAGVTGTTVQAMLAALKALIDLCDTSAESDDKLNLKADKTTTDKLVKTITLNADTGVFTIQTDDGTTTTIDTMLEKIPVNCHLDGQEFVLVLDDGTEQRADLSDFITETEFTDSSTIDFSVTGSNVTATIKNGSITLSMLENTVITTLQGYMTAAQTAAGNAATSETNAGTYAGQAETAKTTAQTAASEAEAHATEAESWAVGGTSSRTGEDTNNSKYFAQQAAGSAQSAHTYADNAMADADRAEQAANDAEAIVGGDFIPNSQKGVPNGVATLDGTGKVPASQLPEDDPDAVAVTLTVAGWTGSAAPYSQTVTVEGVSADEELQLITPWPDEDYLDEYLSCNVKLSSQAADSVTFTCDEKPANAIPVTITVELIGDETFNPKPDIVEDGSITTEKLADGAVTLQKLAGTTVVQRQLYSFDDFKTNGVTGYLNISNGTINGVDSGEQITDTTNGYMTSPYYAVEPNTLFTTNIIPFSFAAYDSEKEFISILSLTTPAYNKTLRQFTTPENSAYIRWCKSFNIQDEQAKSWMICMGDRLYDEYFYGDKYGMTNYQEKCIPGGIIKDSSLSGSALIDGSVDLSALKNASVLMQLFDLTDFKTNGTPGGAVWPNGSVVTGNISLYWASKHVPAKANTIYTCNFKPYIFNGYADYGGIGCYDEDKVFIGIAPRNADGQFTTLEDTAYIIFSVNEDTSEENLADHMICEGDSLFGGYVPGGAYLVTNLMLDKCAPENTVDGKILLDGSVPQSKIAPTQKLKILCYGDSLTQGKYPSKVATLLQADVTDAGVGGNTIAQIYNRVGNYGTDFDVITLMCGTNDNGGQTSCPLGTIDDPAATDENASDPSTSYVSRLKRLIDKIKTTYPGKVYVIMPPFEHEWSAMENVANMMENIAKLYSIPYLDIFHLCGWRGTNAADKALYMVDQTHENDAGAQRIAELLAGFIRQIKGM